MVDGKPIGIGTVAYVMGMSSKKLFRWYKEVLSGYDDADKSGELIKHDISVREAGESKTIAVPILEENNIGEYLCVDEKSINGDIYTILSNRETGKVVMMAATIKTKYLVQILKSIDIEKRMNVKSLSRDMAIHYDWFGKQAFMNAYHVIDKFHVISNVLEQVQASRIQHRQIELTKRREACKNKQPYDETTFENGDTLLQLLARSRGLLFLFPQQWREQQKQRAEILFKTFPQIKIVYKNVLALRRWYMPPRGKTTYQKTRDKKKKQLIELIKTFLKSGIDELMNIAHMMNKNMLNILHYFFAKESNAKAEAINQNIQRFINTNYGTRNIRFFLFRLKIYFA